MSASLRSTALDWLAGEVAAIVVEVFAARGSVPRDVGTRMLVAPSRIAGTIGGGHLELEAIARARAMLAAGDRAARSERYALGPRLGQCCGGAVDLSFAPLDAARIAAWPASEPLFRLQLHGAGHVGRAIATLLATLDCDVDWYDERDEEFPAHTALGSAWPAHVRRAEATTIERAVAAAPAGAMHLVVTHEHALDLRIVEQVLRRGDFAFCGLIGSKTKRASFASRLSAKGVATEAIERMTCPIGIAGITGKAPEVIAAAVVAQLLQIATGVGAAEQPSPPALSRFAGEGA